MVCGGTAVVAQRGQHQAVEAGQDDVAGAAGDPAGAAGADQIISADHAGRVGTADVTGRAARPGVGGDDRVFERGAAIGRVINSTACGRGVAGDRAGIQVRRGRSL